MNDHNGFHVSQLVSGEWELFEESSGRQTGVYWTQDQAVMAGERRARSAGAMLVVYNRFGDVEETRDYGAR